MSRLTAVDSLSARTVTEPEWPASVTQFLLSNLRARRAVAFLRVDASLLVADAGGELANYGLQGVRIGVSACEQAVFLAGLLPAPELPFCLESVQMPSGRSADLHLVADSADTWVLLLDVSVERDEAWRFQQRAYEMTLLSEREGQLIQRLESANRSLQRTQLALEQSREALLRANRRLEQELTDAANYVRSILPPPLSTPFEVDWRFVPSTELGGDSFGYHWIDEHHFALYILDVCGHGVGSALLSVAASNALRSQALPSADFREPDEVLTALNQAFLMEKNNDLYLTIWYGVYHRGSRQLEYACAGHPPALLLRGPAHEAARVDELRARGTVLGITSGVRYRSQTTTVPPDTRLFLLTDGAFEVRRPDGTVLPYAEFLDHLVQPIADGTSELDRLLTFMGETHGPGPLEDDFSAVKFRFP